MAFKVPEQYRVRSGAMASSKQEGNNGMFVVPHPKIKHATMFCIACDLPSEPGGQAWEHISTSVKSPKMIFNRCPNWDEMKFVKEMFWDDEDVCIQYHPKQSEYINTHEFVLHIWRPVGIELPRPEKDMV